MTPPTVQFIPASGLSLTIHDTFGGSGYLDGRTPDTVDNGNTWSSSASTDWPISSGYAYRAAGDYTAQIDPGTTTFRLEVEMHVTTSRQHGISLLFNGPTANQTQFYTPFHMTGLYLFERVNGTNYNTLLHSSPAFSSNVSSFWTITVDGLDVDYEVVQSGTTLFSGSTTLRLSTGSVGLFHTNTGTSTQTRDFKVYT